MTLLPTYITAFTLTSALGNGNTATWQSIADKRGGLVRQSLAPLAGETWFGRVDDSNFSPIPASLSAFDRPYAVCPQLVQGALQQDGFIAQVARVKQRYGARRIACFIGTIVGGSLCLERMYQDERITYYGPMHYHGSVNIPVHFARQYLGVSGVYGTISTACSSSAKVFATAYRYLYSGLCDAVVVGGVEAFSELLLYGFHGMGVLSAQPCRPWDAARNGISLGAAAGFALLEREPDRADNIRLFGYGETADAHHMTAPHQDGEGIAAAMRAALQSADLSPQDVDYINTHGSGTPLNEIAEDKAIYELFGGDVWCSSTKGWTGHTQGACSITEAVITFLAMQHGVVPANLNTQTVDPAARCRIALTNTPHTIRYALSNSMGFGGNNAALLFGLST